jgi:hypothetical protein
MIKAITLLLLLATPICASDQAERPVELYLTTGGAFPTRDLDVHYNFGLNGSAGLGFRLTHHLRTVAKFEVQSFALDQSAFFDSVSGAGRTSLMFGLDLRYYRDIAHWPLDPLLIVGGGIAYTSVGQITAGSSTFDSQTETKPYFNFGIGFDIPLSNRVSAFALARYVQVSSGFTKAEFFPINVGVRYPI